MAAVGEAEAKQIASLGEKHGRSLLAELMNFGPYEDECNMQKSIQVDFFYDHLMFAVKKGFPWEQVCCVVQFADEFLATATDKTITEAVRLYIAQSTNLLLELGECKYKVYTDFLFTTFFTHFQLYKYVMTYPRKAKIPHLTMDVYPPVPPLPLAAAKEKSVWMYDNKLENVENHEFELLKERLIHQEQITQEMMDKKTVVSSTVESLEQPLTKDALGDMLRSLLSEYTEATSKALTTKIADVRKDLEVKLEKTCLPRPAVLGPPPRFKPKSPIPLLSKQGTGHGKGDKKNKNSNSSTDKPKSAKSAKSSARSRASSRGSKHT
ncbi:uncharacterized protein C8orf74 homolog [Littorina saxatilis]|uniref:Uncharacterized protein n=1 Tax=Littorina saxatilis TaxID=31220 RepID=A0AAN9GAR4_9CAEN